MTLSTAYKMTHKLDLRYCCLIVSFDQRGLELARELCTSTCLRRDLGSVRFLFNLEPYARAESLAFLRVHSPKQPY